VIRADARAPRTAWPGVQHGGSRVVATERQRLGQDMALMAAGCDTRPGESRGSLLPESAESSAIRIPIRPRLGGCLPRGRATCCRAPSDRREEPRAQDQAQPPARLACTRSPQGVAEIQDGVRCICSRGAHPSRAASLSVRTATNDRAQAWCCNCRSTSRRWSRPANRTSRSPPRPVGPHRVTERRPLRRGTRGLGLQPHRHMAYSICLFHYPLIVLLGGADRC
jgi:hypothetical protein